MLGQAPTGRRFAGVDKIYIFEVRRRLTDAVAVADNLNRVRQLGLSSRA